MEEAYSTFKIAEICRVTPRTVANWIDDNLIKSFKTPGNYRKVLRSDLENYETDYILPRARDEEASDSGQWGIAARYFVESLNATEFGLYFMNYHSRTPIFSAYNA